MEMLPQLKNYQIPMILSKCLLEKNIGIILEVVLDIPFTIFFKRLPNFSCKFFHKEMLAVDSLHGQPAYM